MGTIGRSVLTSSQEWQRFWTKIHMCPTIQVGVRAWPHTVISSLGAQARAVVVRLRRSVLHVVRHRHLLTSGWVPWGPVSARRATLGTRMGPYLSRTPIQVHRVICQGSSGPIGPYRLKSGSVGSRQNHDLAQQAPTSFHGSLDCPVSVHD